VLPVSPAAQPSTRPGHQLIAQILHRYAKSADPHRTAFPPRSLPPTSPRTDPDEFHQTRPGCRRIHHFVGPYSPEAGTVDYASGPTTSSRRAASHIASWSLSATDYVNVISVQHLRQKRSLKHTPSSGHHDPSPATKMASSPRKHRGAPCQINPRPAVIAMAPSTHPTRQNTQAPTKCV